MAQGVPGRLRPQISTFGTTRVVGRQPNAPAAFTPGEIPGTHFQRLSGPQGTWFCRKEPRKKSQVTSPGIDPGTVRLVAQRLNRYTTPGPVLNYNATLKFNRKSLYSTHRLLYIFVSSLPHSYRTLAPSLPTLCYKISDKRHSKHAGSSGRAV